MHDQWSGGATKKIVETGGQDDQEAPSAGKEAVWRRHDHMPMYSLTITVATSSAATGTTSATSATSACHMGPSAAKCSIQCWHKHFVEGQRKY